MTSTKTIFQNLARQLKVVLGTSVLDVIRFDGDPFDAVQVHFGRAGVQAAGTVVCVGFEVSDVRLTSSSGGALDSAIPLSVVLVHKLANGREKYVQGIEALDDVMDTVMDGTFEKDVFTTAHFPVVAGTTTPGLWASGIRSIERQSSEGLGFESGWTGRIVRFIVKRREP